MERLRVVGVGSVHGTALPRGKVKQPEVRLVMPDTELAVVRERDAMSEAERSLMTVNLRVDEDVRMGIVSDVKQELRRCSALKIMYAARKPGKD